MATRLIAETVEMNATFAAKKFVEIEFVIKLEIEPKVALRAAVESVERNATFANRLVVDKVEKLPSSPSKSPVEIAFVDKEEIWANSAASV